MKMETEHQDLWDPAKPILTGSSVTLDAYMKSGFNRTTS